MGKKTTVIPEPDPNVRCPRARRFNHSLRYRARKDPAVLAIARMIVAGVDLRYDLHPHYADYVAGSGEPRAQYIVRAAVTGPGSCDILQTDMGFGGCGLYGGLSDDGTCFILYEWTEDHPQLRIEMTAQDARDIVSGKKRIVQFIHCTPEHFDERKRLRESSST